MEELRKKKIRKQNIISISILVIGVVLSFLFFGPKNSRSQEDQNNQQKKVAVKTLIAGGEEMKVATLEKTATFSSGIDSDVVAEYSGRITDVSFEVGVYVKEGQEIARFDQSNTQNSARISYESSLTTLDVARKNLSETEVLVKENLELAKNARKVAELQLDQEKDTPDNSDAIKIAERNLENAKDLEDQAERQAELTLNSAKLQVSQSETGARTAKVAYEKTIIRAPISGLVVSKKVNEGDYVYNGRVVAQIVGGGKLQTTISLSGSQVERIKSGDDVEIEIEGEKFVGEIVSFSPVANSENERFDVLIKTIDDISDKANRSGKVSLKLYLDEARENVFFVPLEAVNIGQRKTVIFIVSDGKVASKEIETGEVIGTQIEVLSGISKGDEVIVENSRNIQEGEIVEVE